MKNTFSSLLLFLLFFTLDARAQAGLLDTSFGVNGKVFTTFPTSGQDAANAVAMQSDQKIVAAGFAQGSANRDFGLARYLPNGGLDNNFGTNGKRTIDFGAGDDVASAVLPQADGRIILAGTAANSSVGSSFALCRLLANGHIDSTFGINGRITTLPGAGKSEAVAAVQQTDGKIVVAGTVFLNGNLGSFALVRYHAQGTIDSSFGLNGVVITALDAQDCKAKAMVLRPDGKINVAGQVTVGNNANFALLQLDADGVPDGNFGNAGWQTTDFNGANDFANAMVLQTDGKIVVAGRTALNPGNAFALARYHTDGSLDDSFGSNGKTVTSFETSYIGSAANALVVQPDGKIVAAGYTYKSPYEAYYFILARYNTDGSKDNGFQSPSINIENVVGYDVVNAAVLQADGKIVVAGRTSSFNFGLARYFSGLPVSSTYAPFAGQAGSIYPNPFTTSVTIKYNLQRAEPVSIVLYGPAGNVVSRLADQVPQTAGPQVQSFALPGDLPAGVYFLVLTSASGRTSWRVVK